MSYTGQLETDAADNARAHLASMVEYRRAYDALESGDVETVEIHGNEFKETWEVLDRAQEMPLSLELRSGWYVVGGDPDPQDFRLLLTYGGPLCEIIGAVDPANLTPVDPRLYASEMGAGRFEVLPADDEEREALEWFCSLFYLGE